MAGEQGAQRELGGVIADFVAWWADELQRIFPRASVWLTGRRATATLALTRERIVATRPAGRGLPPRTLVLDVHWPALSSGEDAAVQLREFVAGCDLRLVLGDGDALRFEVCLPAAARLDAETVGLALLSHCPLEPSSVAYGWCSKGRLPDTELVAVDVLICRKALLGQLIERCESLRLPLAAIGANHDAGVHGVALDLHTGVPLRRRSIAGAGGLRVLVAIGAAGLALGLLGTGLWALWAVRGLNAELEQLAEERQVRRPLLQRLQLLERVESDVAALHTLPLATAVLNEMARLVPSDAWLMQLRVADGKLKAAGLADAPTTMMTGFAGSRLIRGAKLDAVAASNAPGRQSQFELSGRLERSR